MEETYLFMGFTENLKVIDAIEELRC